MNMAEAARLRAVETRITDSNDEQRLLIARLDKIEGSCTWLIDEVKKIRESLESKRKS